jgi:L-type amino acid transporter 9
MTNSSAVTDDGVTATAEDSETQELHTSIPPAQLSWLQACAILVSCQIGSGIFSSPSTVDSNAPSPALALGIWLLAGLVSWAGAAAFAELGASLRRAGGILEYIRYVYGDALACMFAWIWIVAVKPSAMAIQAVVVGDSVAFALGGKNGPTMKVWQMKIVGIISMNLIVLLNFRSTRASAWLSGGFSFLKVAAATAISLGGLTIVLRHLAGHRDPENNDWYTRSWFQPRVVHTEKKVIDWNRLEWWQYFEHFSVAMYAGLWAYSGWDNVSITNVETLGI